MGKSKSEKCGFSCCSCHQERAGILPPGVTRYLHFPSYAVELTPRSPPPRWLPSLTSVFANFSGPLSLKHYINQHSAFIKYISHNNHSRNNNNNTFHSGGPFLLRISGCFTNIHEGSHAAEGYFPLKQRIPLSFLSGISAQKRARWHSPRRQV